MDETRSRRPNCLPCLQRHWPCRMSHMLRAGSHKFYGSTGVTQGRESSSLFDVLRHDPCALLQMLGDWRSPASHWFSRVKTGLHHYGASEGVLVNLLTVLTGNRFVVACPIACNA